MRRFALVLVVAAAGCDEPFLAPDAGPDMTGVIVRAGEGLWSGRPGPPYQVHVKSGPDEECGVIFSIRDETVVRDLLRVQTSDPFEELLAVGVRVAVWHGIVLESCPGQSTPYLIQVLE